MFAAARPDRMDPGVDCLPESGSPAPGVSFAECLVRPPTPRDLPRRGLGDHRFRQPRIPQVRIRKRSDGEVSVGQPSEPRGADRWPGEGAIDVTVRLVARLSRSEELQGVVSVIDEQNAPTERSNGETEQVTSCTCWIGLR